MKIAAKRPSYKESIDTYMLTCYDKMYNIVFYLLKTIS